MARTVEVTIGGTVYRMPASYKAAREIAQKVGDPLKLAVAAYRQGGAVSMSVDDVVNVIAIGAGLAGCSLTVEAVGDAIVEAGVMEYLPVVGDYILAIVSGAGDSGPKG
jgi:hypothetical protein